MKTSKQIADWILSKINIEAGDTISPLKLQKLLYYCQAWHLAVFGKPLFVEEIEAWSHGPVIPSQYKRFASTLRNGSINTNNIKKESIVFTNKETENLLEEVLEIYNEHSANYLENLTHSEKPWIEARGCLQPWESSNSIIQKESMKTFYTELNSGQKG